MMALLKTLHIAALVVWCASLLVLPLLLALHRWVQVQPTLQAMQAHYTRFRQLTHLTYTGIATPAAVVAIAAGTALIFVAQVFEVWLLLKLLLVAGMVLGHAWLGHLVVLSYEQDVHWRMPRPAWSMLVTVPCMLGVLWLVLSKPNLLGWVAQLPAWTREPLGLDVASWMAPALQWLGWDQEALP